MERHAPSGTVPSFARRIKNPVPELLRQTSESLTEVLRELEPDAARWVTEAAERASAKPSVVVVGETGRGKSSLVNALTPLLETITVVDTPGVGGLDSMHGELALEAAAGATALLFVVDASAPLTAGELSFLRRAGDRVERVLFALAKTDAFRGWAQIRQANTELLATHAPRFSGAEFHPVSARLCELAGTAPNAQTAAMLREQSGIPALRAAAESAVTGRATLLRDANTLRALATAFGEQEVRLRAEVRTLNAGESEADALRTRRDDLRVQRRSSTKGWQLTLRSELQKVRVDTTHEVARQMREVQSWFRTEIEAAGRDRLAELPQEVDNALRVVSARVSAALGARLDAAAHRALTGLFSPDELRVILAQFARATAPPIVLRPPAKRAPTAEDKLMVGMGTYVGIGVTNTGLGLAGLSLSALGGIVAAPVIAVGLGAGWWIGRTRKHAADKAHVKTWLTEAIAHARSLLDELVAEQLIEADHGLTMALDGALGRRIEAIEGELKEVDRALQLSAAEKSKLLGSAGQRLKQAEDGRKRAEEVLATFGNQTALR